MILFPYLSLAHIQANSTADGIVSNLSNGSVIEVRPALYAAVAVLLSLAGVYLARLITIDGENKRLGRIQTLRETGPLTWIAVLVVCPAVWWFKVSIPFAAPIGVGVGYSAKVVLKILGAGATGALRSAVRGAAGALEDAEAMKHSQLPDDDDSLLRVVHRLDDTPATPVPPAPEID